jgi:hypothetical protein
MTAHDTIAAIIIAVPVVLVIVSQLMQIRANNRIIRASKRKRLEISE